MLKYPVFHSPERYAVTWSYSPCSCLFMHIVELCLLAAVLDQCRTICVNAFLIQAREFFLLVILITKLKSAPPCLQNVYSLHIMSMFRLRIIKVACDIVVYLSHSLFHSHMNDIFMLPLVKLFVKYKIKGRYLFVIIGCCLYEI